MDPLAERLRKERVAKGLSTSELADLTKVREQYIIALERSTYNVLPAVYVRSFIKTLGTSLQIPQHELQRLMSAALDRDDTDSFHSYRSETAGQTAYGSREPLEKTSDTVVNLFSRSTSQFSRAVPLLLELVNRLKRRTILLGTIAVLVIGTALTMYLMSSDDAPETDSSDVVDVSSEGPLSLLAIADDTCQFNINIDNQHNVKVVLMPDKEYKWTASERFVINNIFNAGAVRFSRNGEAFQKFAKPNEVLRELTITRKQILASNAPVRLIPKPTSSDSMPSMKPKSPNTAAARDKTKNKAKSKNPTKAKAKAAKSARKTEGTKKPLGN